MTAFATMVLRVKILIMLAARRARLADPLLPACKVDYVMLAEERIHRRAGQWGRGNATFSIVYGLLAKRGDVPRFLTPDGIASWMFVAERERALLDRLCKADVNARAVSSEQAGGYLIPWELIPDVQRLVRSPPDDGRATE